MMLVVLRGPTSGEEATTAALALGIPLVRYPGRP